MRGFIASLSLGVLLLGCQAHHSSHAKSDACCGLEGSALVSATTQPTTPKLMAAFGAPMKLTDADAVPAATVLSEPDKYKNQYVRITGKVSQVCEKKGCWLRVVPAAQSPAAPSAGATPALTDIFIKFSDPPAGRLVPLDAVGHDVTVEGTVKVGLMPERAARHFKEDAGAPQAEIEKIVGPQKQLVLAGAGVAIEGVKKPAE